ALRAESRGIPHPRQPPHPGGPDGVPEAARLGELAPAPERLTLAGELLPDPIDELPRGGTRLRFAGVDRIERARDPLALAEERNQLLGAQRLDDERHAPERDALSVDRRLDHLVVLAK